MVFRYRFGFGLGGLLTALPAWAKEGQPGVEPTLFVLGVATAFAVGAVVGYVAGKSSSSSNKDGQ